QSALGGCEVEQHAAVAPELGDVRLAAPADDHVPVPDELGVAHEAAADPAGGVCELARELRACVLPIEPDHERPGLRLDERLAAVVEDCDQPVAVMPGV